VQFPLLGLIHCNGNDEGVETHPLFQYLTEALPNGPKGKNIEWNFAKFLVNDKGVPVKRFGYKQSLDKVEEEIAAMLAS